MRKSNTILEFLQHDALAIHTHSALDATACGVCPFVCLLHAGVDLNG